MQTESITREGLIAELMETTGADYNAAQDALNDAQDSWIENDYQPQDDDFNDDSYVDYLLETATDALNEI